MALVPERGMTMSVRVDGVWYHNSADYQRAQAERDLRQARAEASALQADADRHRRRAQEVEAELRSARGDLARQERLHAELRQHVADLQRTQERLRQAQERAEQETARKFRDVEAAVRDQQEDVEAARRAHEAHVREVRAAFEEARRDLAAGLAEAERRRAGTEQALRDEVRQVDDKVEADRRERRAKARTDAGRAGVEMDLAEARLPALAARRDALGLHEQLVSAELAIQKARKYLAEDDPTQALANADQADRAVTGAEREAIRRQAELDARRAWVTATAQDLLAQLNRVSADGRNDVRAFFPRDTAQAEHYLKAIRDRAAAEYTSYSRLEVQRSRDEQALDALDRAVRSLSVSGPIVRDLFLQRMDRVDEIMDSLRRQFGLETWHEVTIPDDPKSDQVIRCDFAGTKVDVYVPLEPGGKVRIDGYGHQTNADCEAAARAMTEIVREQAPGLASVQGGDRARTEPEVRAETARAPWAEVGDHLRSAEQWL